MAQFGSTKGNERYTYRNLDVWQKTHRLTLEIIRVSSALPRTAAGDILGRQILRSASSVGANIAEGHGRFSLAAFRNHLLTARGSATETDNWLAVLHDAGYIDGETEDRLHRECDVLVAALTNRIRAISQKMGSSQTVLSDASSEYVTPRSSEDSDLFDSSTVQLFDEAPPAPEGDIT